MFVRSNSSSQTQESGVPTYRDGDGLWKRYDAMEARAYCSPCHGTSKVKTTKPENDDICWYLGGGNSNIFYFLADPIFWRLHIFSDELVQPATRYYLNRLSYIHSTIFSTIALFKNLPMGPGVQFVGCGWGAIKGGHQFREFVTWQAEILACFIGKKWLLYIPRLVEDDWIVIFVVEILINQPVSWDGTELFFRLLDEGLGLWTRIQWDSSWQESGAHSGDLPTQGVWDKDVSILWNS